MNPAICARLRLAPIAGFEMSRWLIGVSSGRRFKLSLEGDPGEKWTSQTGAGRKGVGTLRTDIIPAEAGQSGGT